MCVCICVGCIYICECLGPILIMGVIQELTTLLFGVFLVGGDRFLLCN